VSVKLGGASKLNEKNSIKKNNKKLDHKKVLLFTHNY